MAVLFTKTHSDGPACEIPTSTIAAGRRYLYVLTAYMEEDGLTYHFDGWVDDNKTSTYPWYPALYMSYNQGSRARELWNDVGGTGSSFTPAGMQHIKQYVTDNWWTILLRLGGPEARVK